jgi:hypothetical protein
MRGPSHSLASHSTGKKVIIGLVLLSLGPLALLPSLFSRLAVSDENNFELDQQMIMPEQRFVNDDTTTMRRDNIGKLTDATFTSEAVVASDKLLRDSDFNNGSDNEDVNASNQIPEALQPLTSKKCCFPKFLLNVPSDVKCKGTCFSERACNDTNYPFASSAEKEFMKKREVTKMFHRELRSVCSSHTHPPPIEWCQRPHLNSRSNSTPTYLVNNIPPTGCTYSFHARGSGAFQHVIIFPSAKLAFCGIPKVGITQWAQFSRYVAGAKDYLSLPHYKVDAGLFEFDQLNEETQRQIWESEEWTWAAFIRNPVERLLSGFLDKIAPIVNPNQSRGKCERSWVDNLNITFESSNTTLKEEFLASLKKEKDRLTLAERKQVFEKFVETLSKPSNRTTCNADKNEDTCMNGLGWCTNPHFRPQVYSCGMSERLDRFQYVGSIENIAEQTKELLQQVGLWESHGKHFINKGTSTGLHKVCAILPSKSSRHVGFQQPDKTKNISAADTTYGHSKGASKKKDLYFTPEMTEKVQNEMYADDYKLWKLVSASEKLSTGKELAAQLSSQCSP